MTGYQEISCHLVFDVKMDFTRKARFVANGSQTEAPISITYSSVVSSYSVRLAFLIAALNDLDIIFGYANHFVLKLFFFIDCCIRTYFFKCIYATL